MKRLQRQIPTATLLILLVFAVIFALSLSVFLKYSPETISVCEPPPPLSSPSSDPNIITLIIAGATVALIPVSFSFLIEKLSSQKKR